MPNSLVESFELLVEADQLAPRLQAAATALAQLPDLDDEKAWLAAANARLSGADVTSHGELLDRALRLRELEDVKGERGKLLQEAIANEVDRLQASITLAGGARSPLMDVIFGNFKVPALRKCNAADLQKFDAELEKRLTSTYTKRVLGGAPWKDVVATVQSYRAAVAKWRAVFVEPPLADDDPETALIKDALTSAANHVQLRVRQARLLAQAALLPAIELLDGAGLLTAKAQRRGKDEDTHALLTTDPPDPLLPTPDERAELSALLGTPRHRA